MTGVLCLQGGREFTPDCDDMDRRVIEAGGSTGIAVLAGAARVGSDHDGAVERAVRHYARLGVPGRAVPDPRTDRDGALDALRALGTDDLLVLPGGSPTSLLDVLVGGDGAVAHAVVEHHRRGGAISGASAGAMVMCGEMIRPDQAGDRVGGLALVCGLALPHWSPGSDRGWATGDVDLWGLPECGGVLLVDDSDPVAVGCGDPARRLDGVWHPLHR